MKVYILQRKNTGALVVASKEIGLEVNTDKTKYMVMSRAQNAGLTHSIKTDNSSFQRVEEFKYLGTNLTFVYPCIASIIVNDDQQAATILVYLFIPISSTCFG